MRQMSHSVSSPDAAGGPRGPGAAMALDPIDVADYLLEQLLSHSATAAWLEPREAGIHRATIEQRGDIVATYELDDGLGDAVLARLALLADLDLASREGQAGVTRVRQGQTVEEVVVAMRVTEWGLSGEVRLQSGRITEVAAAGGAPGAPLREVFDPGTLIGAYRVCRELGRGGMGVVYDVEHTVLGKHFAMKVLSGEQLEDDPTSAQRFVREARAAARIEHPGIVAVSDFGTLPDGRSYLVMELLRGRALGEILAEGGPLAPERAVRLCRMTAEALRVAHAAGVIHRDLTPSNVFTVGEGPEERVVLVDFGQAISIDDPESEGVPDGPPGMVIGTPHYMSPEQIRGRDTDSRTDLYSLGIVLHELLGGEPPFDGETARDIALAHLQSPPPAATSPHQELPIELVQVIQRLLAKDVEDRVASAAELAATLERVEHLLGRRGWRRWLAS